MNNTQISFLQNYTPTTLPESQNKSENSIFDEDEISDPKLRMQSEIIKSMFLKIDEDKKEQKASDKKQDKVDISELGKRLSNALENIRLSDGGELSISYEKVEYMSLNISVENQQTQEADPLILDLDGDGIELTDIRKGDGVDFDITGDGQSERVSWVKGNDGFLVYDRDGNGTIDSGKELFGDQNGAKNGFSELAKFDSNGDNKISDLDEIYTNLKVWQDKNQNGISEKNELSTLNELGITEISLKSDNTQSEIEGNRVDGYSTYSANSVKRAVGELFLNYLA